MFHWSRGSDERGQSKERNNKAYLSNRPKNPYYRWYLKKTETTYSEWFLTLPITQTKCKKTN